MRIVHNRWWVLPMTILAASSAFAEQRLFDKKFAATAGNMLSIETDIGAITVSGSDSNDVVVHAVLSGDRVLVDRFEITADSTNEGVAIRGRRSDDSWLNLSWMFGAGLDVRYTIQVPRNYHVQVNNSRGDLELRDFNGKAYAHTSRGDVSVSGINGAVQIDTSRGSVRGTQLTGNVSVVTSRGNVQLEKVLGPMDVRTSRGDVKVELTNPHHGADLHTSRGDVTITLPKQFAANLDAHTSRGDLDCDLPVTTTTRTSDNHRHALSGTLNGGGKPLTIDTSRGDIRIRTGS